MKTNLFKYLLVGTIFCASTKNAIVAQEGFQCGTAQAYQKLYAEHPELIQEEAAYNAAIAQAIQDKKNMKTAEQVYIIPIVFHVLHTFGSENITDAQIQNQVDILNRDFRKLNSDTANVIPEFQGLIPDCKIEFRLAKLDPNGNCTNGIDRIYSQKTNVGNEDAKLNPWPRNMYLNVWVINTMETPGAAGYAYKPSGVNSPWAAAVDGIIILHDYIGSIGTGNVGRSRALTHEVGHWINLDHTWGGTNNPNVACGDDAVDDTPVTKGHDNCNNRFDFFCSSAAIAPLYHFSDVTTSSGTTDPTAVPMPADTGLIYSSVVANGVSANSSTPGYFEFTNWDNGAADGATSFASLTGVINTGKYYEFSVTPAFGNALTLTGLSFKVKRDATGARTYAVRSNSNSYASNLNASITPANPALSVQAGNTFFINNDAAVDVNGSRITLSGAAFTNISNNTTRTFRIYAFNAEDTIGTFGIDSIRLIGTSGTIENVENYMEYSYCSKMFTYGQKDRMRAALESVIAQRRSLWQPSNLAATGVDPIAPDCAPKADFYSNRTTLCVGNTVLFTRYVTQGTPTSTTWYLPGSTTPVVTTTANTVTAVYNTTGVHDVKMVASNSSGADSITKNFHITVTNTWGDFMGNGYYDTFEDENHFWYFWKVRNLDNNANTFTLANVGYNSSKSVIMGGYQNYNSDLDELLSPSFDLSNITSNGQLSFKYAYASRGITTADNNEKLVISYSANCGGTWTPITGGTMTNAALANNGYFDGYFLPTSESQWATKTITLPPAALVSNVRFKFAFTSGYATNNLYIDNVNIAGVVGVAENANDFNLSIFPNPSSTTSTISYHLNQKGAVKLEVVDLLGKKVADVVNTNQAEGDYTYTISKVDNKLNNGIYFIRLSVNNSIVTKKIVITE